jgi:hypothetical protein
LLHIDTTSNIENFATINKKNDVDSVSEGGGSDNSDSEMNGDSDSDGDGDSDGGNSGVAPYLDDNLHPPSSVVLELRAAQSVLGMEAMAADDMMVRD